MVGDRISNETSTAATIGAGSTYSVGFLKMVIQDTVDNLTVGHPLATWRMYVNDPCIKQLCNQNWVEDIRGSRVAVLGRRER